MNVYIAILSEVVGIIQTLHGSGKTVPTSVMTVLEKGLALVSAFGAAQSNLVPISSVGTAIQDFEQALSVLKAAGIDIPGENPFLSVVNKYEATKADLESGQAAFLGSAPYSDAAKGIVGKTVNFYGVFAGSTGETALIGSNG